MIKSGDIFVCIKGFKDNGYRYIEKAEDRGAVAIVADSITYSKIPVILCENPRRKIAELAKRIYKNPDEKMKLIGVTGTNGKTTVTHLIRDILVEAGEKVAMIGTNGCYYNNQPTGEIFQNSTTPDSAQMYRILNNMYELGCKYAVCEVSSHALVLDRVYGMDFDIGIFTNLMQEHLDFHKNMENYFAAKEKLFKMSKNCIINTDDEYGKRLYDKFKEKSKSIGRYDAEVLAKDIKYDITGAEFIISDKAKDRNAKIPIPGEFSVYNALCAYAAGLAMGIDEGIILKALENTKGVKGRCERVECDAEFSVVIDYAHTPDGLAKIIKTMKNVAKGRVITLFGCGGNRDCTKRPMMGKISGELSDFSIITSDNPREENPVKIIKDIETGIRFVTDNYITIIDRFEAIKYAIGMAKANDVVLLAGKGHEDYIIKGTQKIHFDEREAVRKIINE